MTTIDPPHADPRRPRRNADADWDSWPVQRYLAENYRTLHPSDAAVIAYHSTYYRRLAADSLDRAVEIGAGPNLYPLMLPAAAARHLDAVETSAASLDYLRGQLRDGPDPSWQPFYAHCRSLNPDLPTTLLAALARVTPVRGDLTTVSAGAYDLASMHFVAESVTADADEFGRLCHAYVATVRIGGHLVAAFMENMATYRLGDGSTWPGYPVDIATLRDVFAPYTRQLWLRRVEADETLPDYGDTGMIVLHARRAR